MRADRRRAGDSAAALTAQFLAFSRRQILQPEALDLNAVVQRMESRLRRLIGEHIALRSRLSESLSRVSADPNQLEQIIMSGRELVDNLHAVRPATCVVFASGYTEDAIVRRGVLQASVAFIQKPFTPHGLLSKIREVLDRALAG